MKRNNDLKEFVRCTGLSVMGMLGVSCYILADTYFISKGLGSRGLTALNLAIPAYNFIHGTGLMLGMGGGTRFAVCQSRGDGEKADRAFTASLWLWAAFSALFVAVGLFCSERLTGLLGADSDVFGMTLTYLRVLLLFAPAFMLNDIFLCFVRNDNAPRLAMAATLTSSMANVFLDYIFIFPLGMGIFGAVLATGLSPLISMAVMSGHKIKRRNTFKVVKGLSDGKDIGKVLSTGMPSLVGQLSLGVVMMVFNFLILGIRGNIGVAAYGVIANISIVAEGVLTGIAQGIQPLVSRFYGTGETDRAAATLRRAMMAVAASSAVIYGVIFIFSGPITAAFNSEGSASMAAMAVQGLRLYFVSTPFVGCNVVMSTFFSSTERQGAARLISLLRGFFVIIPVAFIMAHLWGMTGVWLSYPVSEATVAAFGISRKKA